MWIKYGWIFAAALIFLGCALNLWMNLPVETTESIISIKGNLEGFPASSLKDRQVKLRLPAELIAGSPVALEMTLLSQSVAGVQPTTEIKFLEGRLDLPDADSFPASSVLSPYLPDKQMTFRWLVTAQDSSMKYGRIWLWAASSSAFDSESLVPVLALPVEFRVRSIWGLTSPTVRGLGVGLGAAGLGLLGFGYLKRKPKNVRRKL
jgi:hypothetical protein